MTPLLEQSVSKIPETSDAAKMTSHRASHSSPVGVLNGTVFLEDSLAVSSKTKQTLTI